MYSNRFSNVSFSDFSLEINRLTLLKSPQPLLIHINLKCATFIVHLQLDSNSFWMFPFQNSDSRCCARYRRYGGSNVFIAYNLTKRKKEQNICWCLCLNICTQQCVNTLIRNKIVVSSSNFDFFSFICGTLCFIKKKNVALV